MGALHKIEVEVVDVHSSAMPSEAFSLILKEKEGNRYVPIIIGMSEARSIVLEINRMIPRRPMSHDLFMKLADYASCEVVEVDIVHFEDGVYFADILMKKSDDTLFHLDARTSDAVVIALKSFAPIFFNADIFIRNCVVEEVVDKPEKVENPKPSSFQDDESENIVPDAYIDQKLKELSTKELNSLLDGAVESEDFELASKIQEELKRRAL